MMEALAIGLALLSVAANVWVLVWSIRLEKAANERLARLREQIAPFDHDGDGKPGGSKPRGKG